MAYGTNAYPLNHARRSSDWRLIRSFLDRIVRDRCLVRRDANCDVFTNFLVSSLRHLLNPPFTTLVQAAALTHLLLGRLLNTSLRHVHLCLWCPV